MCFNLVKTSPEINHSSYSLKVGCYFLTNYQKHNLLCVCAYVNPSLYCIQSHEWKAVSSGEQCFYPTCKVRFPRYMFMYSIHTCWMNESMWPSLFLWTSLFAFSLFGAQGSKVVSRKECCFPLHNLQADQVPYFLVHFSSGIGKGSTCSKRYHLEDSILILEQSVVYVLASLACFFSVVVTYLQ